MRHVVCRVLQQYEASIESKEKMIPIVQFPLLIILSTLITSINPQENNTNTKQTLKPVSFNCHHSNLVKTLSGAVTVVWHTSYNLFTCCLLQDI